MMATRHIGGLALAFMLGAFADAAGAAAGAHAGDVTLMTGRGSATSPDGAVRTLATGDAVYAGEVISSGPNSYVNLKFLDGGLVLLRPRTRFEIQDFAYADQASAAPADVAPAPATPPPTINKPGAPPTAGKPAAPPPVASAPAASSAAPAPPSAPAPVAVASSEQSATTRAFFRLLKGSFRAVSGLIGKANQDDYRVSTPVATIGIRGTDYFVLLIDAAFAKDPVLRATLPPGANAIGGVYVEQFEGSTVVTNNAGKQVFVAKGEHLVTLSTGNQVHVDQPKAIQNDPPPNPKDMKCNQ